MKLHELKQKRDTIATEMRALHEKIGDATWTEEQRTEWGKAKTELQQIDEQVAREEELRMREQKQVESKKDEHRKSEGDVPDPQHERRNAFDKWLRQGMSELSAEERQLLHESRAQGISPNEKGGYTVPTEMQARIVEAMKAYGGIAGVAQILSTADGRPIEWITADGTKEEGELIGENVAAKEEDVEFGTHTLGAQKLSSKIIRISNELLQDSAINMETYLSARIAGRIGRGEARLLVQGTGAGSPLQPKGLEASVTGITYSDKATEFTWQEMNTLYHSLDPAYRAGSSFRWAFNDKTLKAITEMEDAQKRPLWLPNIINGTPATVLGIAYVTDPAIADIGAGKKFIYCGDFNRFVVRRVNYMALMRLVERYAEFDQTAFLAFHRFDCVLEDTSAIKALVGKSASK